MVVSKSGPSFAGGSFDRLRTNGRVCLAPGEHFDKLSTGSVVGLFHAHFYSDQVPRHGENRGVMSDAAAVMGPTDRRRA